METNKNKNNGQGEEINFTRDNSKLKNQNENQKKPDGMLPEDDPAVINPDELATFPDEVKNDDPDTEEERKSRAVNLKSSPVRDGRNITRTDTTADNDGGFM
ncbi:hypothetical protein CHU92_08385 [Flavobacterium cyanobacteriorum]|uniref:Uncharacterized protein n=1 Tax=Flavobacterium cyanobacteriorum TaxID=2022802 RepID=A0A255Z725_9FLAO|nr:hypothetical protein [Flavobacterium cyanobacteriorum]OYQ37343.1 hypothetical protein CHU92_08385 [Flavobacterium cyanobacteriorum]